MKILDRLAPEIAGGRRDPTQVVHALSDILQARMPNDGNAKLSPASPMVNTIIQRQALTRTGRPEHKPQGSTSGIDARGQGTSGSRHPIGSLLGGWWLRQIN